MRKQIAAVAIAAVALGAGCKTVAQQVFNEPVVTFKDARIRGLGLEGGQVDVVLGVYNPNNYSINATRLTYKLMVDSVTFGTGTLDNGANMTRNDTTNITIPVEFRYNAVGNVARQLLATGTANYRIMGDVTLSTPLGNFTRPYNQTGRFSTFGR